jgi:dTDP-4-dehydrorhamnose 3,5-epimerase
VRVIHTELPDVLLLEPTVFSDERGFLFESYRHSSFVAATGSSREFVLELHSHSTRGVVRGIHYQLETPQAKLVRIAQGEVFEVAVDLRRSSPTFGRWCGAHVSAENRHSMWIPRGFGHAFQVLSDSADMLYKLDGDYDPAASRTIFWSDPAIGIRWPAVEGIAAGLLSARDRNAVELANAEVFA